ncbi:MAG: ATP-binding protein, partial [Methanoregula sp.]|nr:ATP-binding protein [Methanoregula sp.]
NRQITFTRDYQDMGVKAPSWQNVWSTIIDAKGALPLGNVTVEMDRPDLELLADPLFEKVFYNLIDNSLKYGGEQLRAIRISSQERGDHLLITYEDDGAGIADADKPHIFERGFGKHTGFGLFLSREILSITGISIRETGEYHNGARFGIVVPKGAWRFTGTK